MNLVSMIKNLYSYDQSFKLVHQSSLRDISYYMRQNLDRKKQNEKNNVNI